LLEHIGFVKYYFMFIVRIVCNLDNKLLEIRIPLHKPNDYLSVFFFFWVSLLRLFDGVKFSIEVCKFSAFRLPTCHRYDLDSHGTASNDKCWQSWSLVLVSDSSDHDEGGM
jgi:hypothetical protein